MKKSVTLNGLVLPNAIYLLINILMIFVGIYLTNHYYNLLFPSGLESASGLCNINEFWGCDKTTRSALGSLFGVPTSVFAIVIAICGLITNFIGKEEYEKTMKSVLALNLVGCIVLFLFSLIALKTICPMCSAYYVLSIIAFVIFQKYSDYSFGFDVKALTVFGVVLLLPSILIGYNVKNKKDNQFKIANSYISQFDALNSYGKPDFESPYKLNMATEKFEDAPLRVSIFSDFQCPFCKSVSDQFHDIIKEFKNEINVQYLFYPLDVTCNTKMKGSLHPFACKAAYLAGCDKEKFAKIHDHIFNNQDKINEAILLQWEKDFGLSGCFENKEAQDFVQQSLNTGDFYKVQSTPTIIINGKKIEGSISTPMLKAILRAQLKK